MGLAVCPPFGLRRTRNLGIHYYSEHTTIPLAFRGNTYTVVAVDRDVAGVLAPRFANIPEDAAVVVPAVLPTADAVFGVPKPAVLTPRQNQRNYDRLSL